MSEKDVKLKVCLVSLGCPKNLVDSERMLGDLAGGGCIVGAPMDQADAIVINTCGFLRAARDESLEVIQEALRHKNTGRARRVVVAGCLPSRDGTDLYQQAPGIDAIIGVNNRDDLLAAVTEDKTLTGLDAFAGGICDDTGRFRITPPHTAYLRVAEGCSQRCSYCTIPAIRGPLRSKPPQAVLAEARELIADGAVELNIIAQDTTAYGTDFAAASNRNTQRTQAVGFEDQAPSLRSFEDLAGLLRALDDLDGIQWIRLMYTYPRRFTDQLIDAMADCPHVVPYVDIPLQHISDQVLKRMGRGVRRTEVESLLAKLRSRVEGIAVRTTFIVGFPGETDDQFDELLKFVEDFRFDALGVFEFSPEDGTPAAKMADQAPDEIKAERRDRIMLAQQQIAFETNEQLIGSDVTVLVDGADAEGKCVGRHYGQAPDVDSICILTDPREAGSFIDGKIVAADRYDLIVQPA